MTLPLCRLSVGDVKICKSCSTYTFHHLNHRCAEPEADSRKKDAFTYMIVLGFTAVMTGYYKRFRWSTFKTRQLTYVK